MVNFIVHAHRCSQMVVDMKCTLNHLYTHLCLSNNSIEKFDFGKILYFNCFCGVQLIPEML